jgi:FMN phosphatase YigB (HAD superfamily)
MKYIALDIGNVLCHVATVPFVENLSETLNITIPEAARFLKRFQQIHDLGYTTMEDELKDKYNVKSPIILKRLVSAWNDSVTPSMPMIEAMNKMREEHNLKVALLSNIGIEHAQMMEEKLQHGNFFPDVIKHFSCHVGARKPSMVYYQSFLIQHPEFKGCLYVDDLMENLTASKQFGFQTFHMSLEEPDVESKIKDIETIIVGPNTGKKKNSRSH